MPVSSPETPPPGNTRTRLFHAPATGWKAFFKKIGFRLSQDHVQVVAAGVAFYFFLAIFPAVAAAVSLYGLVVDAQEVEREMTRLTAVLPAEAQTLIENFLHGLISKSGATLSWSFALSTLLSIYSAKQGVAAIFEGLHVAYRTTDQRGFLPKTALQLTFTFGSLLAGLLAIALVAVWPALVHALPLPPVLSVIIGWGRWLLLGLILVLSLGILYRFAPDKDRPPFTWITLGPLAATVLWMLGSILFSWYIDNYGSYDKTYGTLAAVIILLLWLLLTAFIILLGAEIDSELEQERSRPLRI